MASAHHAISPFALHQVNQAKASHPEETEPDANHATQQRRSDSLGDHPIPHAIHAALGVPSITNLLYSRGNLRRMFRCRGFRGIGAGARTITDTRSLGSGQVERDIGISRVNNGGLSMAGGVITIRFTRLEGRVDNGDCLSISFLNVAAAVLSNLRALIFFPFDLT